MYYFWSYLGPFKSEKKRRCNMRAGNNFKSIVAEFDKQKQIVELSKKKRKNCKKIYLKILKNFFTFSGNLILGLFRD